MKLIGKVTRLGKSAHYGVYDSGGSYLCGDICHSILTDEKYHDDRRIVAFGYDGKAPDLCSAGMLYVAINRPRNFESLNNRIAGRFIDPGYCWVDLDEPRYPIRNRPKVLKLYRKFTQQVVSKLPDNWEMTTEEIMKWVRKGTIPKCVRKV